MFGNRTAQALRIAHQHQQPENPLTARFMEDKARQEQAKAFDQRTYSDGFGEHARVALRSLLGRAEGGAVEETPARDLAAEGAAMWSGTRSPADLEAPRRYVTDFAVNAVDPFNIPSAVTGLVSPEARDAWRARQAESHIVPRIAGQVVGGGGVGGMALKALRSIPALFTAGAGFGGGSDVIDQAAGVEGAVGPGTAAKAGLGGLGGATAGLSLKTLLGGAGAAVAGADIARGGQGPALGSSRIDIGTAEAQIADIGRRMTEIEAQKIANGKDKRLSPVRTSELNASLDAEKQRLENERGNLVQSIAVERRNREVENAPFRERYPLATTAATIGAVPLAAFLTRGGLNKIAEGVTSKVDAAKLAAAEGRSADYVRDTLAAQRLARAAPYKATATGAVAAMTPAEVQMMPDLIDYRLMPRESRAFKEAQQSFSDPQTYLRNLTPMALAGIIGAGSGAKFSNMMKDSGRADAKALGASLRGLDDAPFTDRMLGRGRSAEEMGARWAERSAAQKDAEAALIAANVRRDNARTDAELARQTAAEGQARIDAALRTARGATDDAPRASQQTFGQPSQRARPQSGPEDQALAPDQRPLPPSSSSSNPMALPKPANSNREHHSRFQPREGGRFTPGRPTYPEEDGFAYGGKVRSALRIARRCVGGAGAT